MWAQIAGYKAIRGFQKINAGEYNDNEERFDLQDDHLGNHLINMENPQFLSACGNPATIRIVEPFTYNYFPIFITTIAICLRFLMINSFIYAENKGEMLIRTKWCRRWWHKIQYFQSVKK